MTRFKIIASFLAAVVALAAIGALTYVAVDRHEVDAKINAQTEIEKSKIVETEKTKRSKEHTKWLPWN